MSEVLFNLSYILLCGIVVAESVVLQAIIHEALQISSKRRPVAELQPRSSKPNRSAEGSTLPPFKIPLLDRDAELTNESLMGTSSALLFIRAHPESPPLSTMASIINFLLQKIDGRVHIVCGGTSNRCRQMCTALFPHFTDAEISVGIDPEEDLSKLCHMTSSPAAILVDKSGHVLKSGRYAPELSRGSNAIVALPKGS